MITVCVILIVADACSDALYEYEGIDKGISKRAVQMDIQMMRSEKLGYNAPIVVYENKYYKYEDPEYSITQTPLNEQDLKTMSEAVEVLRQFKGFSYFTEMSEIVNRLEDHRPNEDDSGHRLRKERISERAGLSGYHLPCHRQRTSPAT